MPRRWACLQHVAHEGPGRLVELTATRGLQLEVHRVDWAASLPSVADTEALVVMGGPMGVYEKERYAWITEECALIREFVNAGRFVLGICLGAQLLAHALGARVFRGPTEEIGFGSVVQTAAADSDPVFRGVASPVPVFHWHQDTFDLPAGAVHLASSSQYRNQAFRAGTRAYGFQFHVEIDDDLWRAWTPHLPPKLAAEKSQSRRKDIELVGKELLSRIIELAVS